MRKSFCSKGWCARFCGVELLPLEMYAENPISEKKIQKKASKILKLIIKKDIEVELSECMRC